MCNLEIEAESCTLRQNRTCATNIWGRIEWLEAESNRYIYTLRQNRTTWGRIVQLDEAESNRNIYIYIYLFDSASVIYTIFIWLCFSCRKIIVTFISLALLGSIFCAGYNGVAHFNHLFIVNELLTLMTNILFV